MRLIHPALLLLLTLPMMAACGGSQAATASTAAGDEARVFRGDLNAKILLTGELEAADNVSLVTPNANIWPVQIRWMVEDGAQVQEGERLVEFDSSQLTSNLEQMLVQVNQIYNEISGRRAQADSSETSAVLELERKEAAVEKARLQADIPQGLEARVDFERKQLDYRTAQLELEEARMKVETSRESAIKDLDVLRIRLEGATRDVNEARRKADLLVLTAPRDGIVLVADNRQEGRPYQTGDNSNPGLVVARLPDLSTMRVMALLFDVDDDRVRLGMQVRGRLDAFPEEEFHGRVTEVKSTAEEASRRSQRRFFKVFVELEGLDPERMRPGMSVRLEIDEDKRQDVLLVPRTSLRWEGQTPRLVLASGALQEVGLGPCDLQYCILEDGPAEGTSLGLATGDAS